jgi:hypothetical protein
VAYLVVQATPPWAQVFLDGRFLGPASQVAAWMIPIVPGYHVVHVAAPGFRPEAVEFVATPIGTPTRIHLALERE